MKSLPAADVLLSGRCDWLDGAWAERFAEHPLESVGSEYPHHVGALEGPDDHVPPGERHPVFYGCFDWHSAVHSHWALVRGLRVVEAHPNRGTIVESIDGRLTAANVDRECDRFDEEPTFEKAYGWGWLLHLAAELDRWDDPLGDTWHATLSPLEETIVDLVRSELLTDERPFRVGTHGNTAFALHCALDYARAVGDRTLETEVVETARAFYGDDTDYPLCYEPLGWDFLSPALTEADLMRRVYEPAAFADWFEDFLPTLAEQPVALPIDPISVGENPEDGVALHYVGLNLARAWSLAGVADGLGDHPAVSGLEEAAGRHATAGLEGAFTDDYAGAHWLSSFALYLVSRNEGGIGTC
jgi:hypothetical protein